MAAKWILTTLWSSLLVLSLAVLLSCAKDSTSSQETVSGDPNDPGFSQTREMVDDAVGEALGQFRLGLNFTDGLLPPTLPKPQDPQDTTYQWTYENGWWWCYIDYSDSNYQIALSDSIQFRSGGEPQMVPDSTTSEMEFRLDTEMVCALYALTLWYDLVYSGLDGDTITVDGDGGYNFSGTYSGYDFYYHFTEILEEVTFEVASDYQQAYPASGTVTVAVVENFTNLSNNDLQGETGWTVKLTFYPDHYHVRAQSGNTVYEYDQDYPV